MEWQKERRSTEVRKIEREGGRKEVRESEQWVLVERKRGQRSVSEKVKKQEKEKR